MAPASGFYSIGSPLVKSAIIKLENGKTFAIEAKDQSERNVYIQQVMLNGVPLMKPVLTHTDIIKGGKLIFYMADQPNKKLFIQ